MERLPRCVHTSGGKERGQASPACAHTAPRDNAERMQVGAHSARRAVTAIAHPARVARKGGGIGGPETSGIALGALLGALLAVFFAVLMAVGQAYATYRLDRGVQQRASRLR